MNTNISFIRGMARSLDLCARNKKYFNAHDCEKISIEALGKDWERIGNDIRKSITEYRHTGQR